MEQCRRINTSTKSLDINLGKLGSVEAYIRVTIEDHRKTDAEKVREQSFTISSIDVKPLQSQNLDVNQVLNRTTGVRIRESGGLGSDFNFSLNGFSGNQVKFFILMNRLILWISCHRKTKLQHKEFDMLPVILYVASIESVLYLLPTQICL